MHFPDGHYAWAHRDEWLASPPPGTDPAPSREGRRVEAGEGRAWPPRMRTDGAHGGPIIETEIGTIGCA